MIECHSPRRFANCAARFTTFERVQLRELTVVEKNSLASR